MAKLSTKARAKLPSSDFAGPDRSYPVENKAHAVAAERLVGRGEAAGNISQATGNKIKAKAAKVLGKKPAMPAKPAKSGGMSNEFGMDNHTGMVHNSTHR